MTREIRPVPLTPEAFAPFGDVVAAALGPGTAANQGTALRFDRAARLESTRANAQANLAVYRCVPRALPLEVALLEKHPRSSQTFLPMLCTRLLVCVAPACADGSPDLSGLTAFVSGPGQGVSYLAGVWHHPIVALDGPAELAMLAWEDGGPLDCVEFPLSERVLVLEPASAG